MLNQPLDNSGNKNKRNSGDKILSIAQDDKVRFESIDATMMFFFNPGCRTNF